MKSVLLRLWKEDEGQDLLEYALLITFVVLVAAALIKPLGTSIGQVFQNANDCLLASNSSTT